MKKLFAFLLLTAALISLFGCSSAPAEPSTEPLPTLAPTEAPSPTPTERPAFEPQGEAQLAGTFQRLDDGTLYCAEAPLEDFIYLPQWLHSEENGSLSYVSSLLADGDKLYFTTKESFLSDDATRIGVADAASGEYRLLAADGSMGSRLALADGQLVYNREDGLRAIDPETGEESAFLEGRYVLHAAYGGWLFYTRDDGVLCRDTAQLDSQEELFSDGIVKYLRADAERLILMTLSDGGCCLYLLDWYGDIQTQTDFSTDSIEMFVQDSEIYLMDSQAMTLEVLSADDLSPLRSIPIDPELVYFSILHIDRDGILHQRRLDGEAATFWRMDPSGDNAVELDTLDLE